MTEAYKQISSLAILATSTLLLTGLSSASTVNFYSQCNGREMFVTLAENVELIIDPAHWTVPVCSMKFTSAHHDVKLRYKFKQVNLISSDVSISLASGIGNILWTQARYDKRVLPPHGEFIMADDQFTVTVERINGIRFYFRLEITAQDQEIHTTKLSQGAIVGIVFGCLLFVNIIAILIGLIYRKLRTKAKMAKVVPAVAALVDHKRNNSILRNTLGTSGTDERIQFHLRKGRPVTSPSNTSKQTPVDLVAKFLASQSTTKSTSIRELPINTPKSARERNSRIPVPGQEQPIRHSTSARQRPIREPFVVEEQLIRLPFSPKKISTQQAFSGQKRLDQKQFYSHETSVQSPTFPTTIVQSRLPWKQCSRNPPSAPTRTEQFTNRKSPVLCRTPELHSRKRKNPDSRLARHRSVWADRTILADNLPMRNPFVFREFPCRQPGSDGNYHVQE